MWRRNMNLSEDLMIDILLRLPVIALLRCKCVCKSWFSLISSPSFIAKHLQVCNTTTKNNPNLLIKTRDRNNWLDMVFIVSCETLEVVETQDDPPRIRGNWWPKLVGSCNGLICIYGDGDGVIWNPATRATIVMSRSLIRGSEITVAGFGFDANINDYKVFLIHSYSHSDTDFEPVKFWLEVYSLRTNSWRLVSGIRGLDLWFEDETVGAYTDGMFSWIAYEEEEDWNSKFGPFLWKDEIVSFDISNEVIVRTPLPSKISAHMAYQIDNHIGVLNGSLVVVNDNIDSIACCEDSGSESMASDVEEKCFDIWVLREIGVVESWTKLYTIGPLQSVPAPLVVWNNGLVFWIENDEELFLHDSANQQKNSIGIPREAYKTMDVIAYRESLVPIKDRRSRNDKIIYAATQLCGQQIGV